MPEPEQHNGWKKFLLYAGTVIATVGAAFQIAGATSVALANVVLVFGVWIFTGAEVWFSAWIRRTKRYRNSVFAAILCVTGCAVLGVKVWITTLINQQRSSTSSPVPVSPQPDKQPTPSASTTPAPSTPASTTKPPKRRSPPSQPSPVQPQPSPEQDPELKLFTNAKQSVEDCNNFMNDLLSRTKGPEGPAATRKAHEDYLRRFYPNYRSENDPQYDKTVWDAFFRDEMRRYAVYRDELTDSYRGLARAIPDKVERPVDPQNIKQPGEVGEVCDALGHLTDEYQEKLAKEGKIK